MKREFARIPIADVVAFICVLVMLWAFQQLNWTNDGRDTGWEIVSDVLEREEGVQPNIILIPLTIIVAGVASIVGLLREDFRKHAAMVTAGIAVVGLIYYVIWLTQNSVDFSEFRKQGFWIVLVGMLGLLVQFFIPRTETQVSITDVDWWKLIPFDINLKNREAIAAYLFLAPFLIFFAIFVVRAVILAVRMSFFNWLILPPTADFIRIENYIELFNDDVWWIALKNTFIFAAFTVTGTTVVALIAALAVIQPVRGQEFFRVLLYMPQLLSVGAVGLIWVWLLNTQFGVINYALDVFFGMRPVNWLGDPQLVLPSLSLTTIWWTFGFPMLIFIAGLQGIPESLYEAAKIDGASPSQIFFNITLPLLRPTILFVTVTGVIGHFQVYGQPFIMTNGGPGRSSYTVIFYLYQIAWTSFRMGYGAAVAVVIAAVMASMTIIQFFIIGRRVEF